MMSSTNKIKQLLLRNLFNMYLRWFDSLATRTRLPFSHIIFIFISIQTHSFKILFTYITLSIMLAYLTDLILMRKKWTKAFSDILKEYSEPDLFLIFGNPGEAAAAKLAGKALGSKAIVATGIACTGGIACDHVLTHTGVYDAISFKVTTGVGIDEKTAISRLPDRNSALDQMLKKGSK